MQVYQGGRMQYQLKNRKPKIHKNTYIADNAIIIRDVELAKNVTIWFGAVLQGILLIT